MTDTLAEKKIGYGAPHKHDTSAAHGEPLGEEGVRLAKRSYGWPEDAKFLVPGGVREHFHKGVGRRGKSLHDAWRARFESYRRSYPGLADEIGGATWVTRRTLWREPRYPWSVTGAPIKTAIGTITKADLLCHPLQASRSKRDESGWLARRTTL